MEQTQTFSPLKLGFNPYSEHCITRAYNVSVPIDDFAFAIHMRQSVLNNQNRPYNIRKELKRCLGAIARDEIKSFHEKHYSSSIRKVFHEKERVSYLNHIFSLNTLFGSKRSKYEARYIYISLYCTLLNRMDSVENLVPFNKTTAFSILLELGQQDPDFSSRISSMGKHKGVAGEKLSYAISQLNLKQKILHMPLAVNNDQQKKTQNKI